MKRPRITIKFAQTLDGRIAAEDGSSKWISGPKARAFARALRAKCGWVLVGIGTVVRDNPTLKPRRIIFDSFLRIPLASKIVKTAGNIETVIFATHRASKSKAAILKKKGVEVIFVPATQCSPGLSPGYIVHVLFRKCIKSVLVEGGSGVITSFLKAGLADEIVAIISPKILGSGLNTVGGLKIRNIKGALNLRLKSMKRLGEDVVCTYAAS